MYFKKGTTIKTCIEPDNSRDSLIFTGPELI
jgi:hypothetical protein